MADKLPSPREPLVSFIKNTFLINTSWYRFFLTNDIPTLNATQIAQQATIDDQALLITELQEAISTIRDVALTNGLTDAAEIPDLARD